MSVLSDVRATPLPPALDATFSPPLPTFFRSRPAAAPADDLDIDSFFTILHGHAAFQLLWAGAESDLFTLLSRHGPLTRAQLAAALELEPQPARVLLTGLTALRLLKPVANGLVNSDLAERFLVRGQPNCLPWLAFQWHIAYQALADLSESLKQNRNVGLRHFPGTGETLYQRIAGHPDLERAFDEGMSCLSDTAAAELAAAADLADRKHLLDVGGGSGTNALPLAQRHPGLKVTIFDLPTVCETARAKIGAASLSDRVAAVGGNFLNDAFPAEIDSILLAHIMTIWSPQRNLALLRKCHAALPPGGKVLIHSMIADDDESGPLVTALSSPYFQTIATGEGMLYSGKDYRAWLRQAGFGAVSLARLPLEHGLFVAVKGHGPEQS